jgi:hypothetical protein
MMHMNDYRRGYDTEDRTLKCMFVVFAIFIALNWWLSK